MEVVVSAGGLIKQIYYKDSARNIKSPLAPPVNFTANDTVVYIGDTVKFTNQTTDILGIYSYAWTFSPGTLSFVDSTSNKVREPHVTFSDTGFYSVTLDVTIPVVNIKGTRAKNNYIWVRALGKPVADFYADRLSPSVTNTVHFTDNSSNGPNQWLWLFSPNTITYMNGSNSTSQNPDVRFDSTGKYTVTLLASNRIGAGTVTKTDYITVSKSAGIESMEELSSLIKIYPNPSGTIFHISTDKLTDDKISAIEVVDLTGRKIFYIRSSMVKSIFDLDLGMFPKGNYMIKFIGKDGVYTRMLLKD